MIAHNKEPTRPSAVPSTLASRPAKDSNRNSIRSMPNAKPVRRTSPASVSEGWVEVETRYDDGGFSGGNIERPALKRLMADIKAGKIDCVVVYKVDRLSRSLMDFVSDHGNVRRPRCLVRFGDAAIQHDVTAWDG